MKKYTILRYIFPALLVLTLGACKKENVDIIADRTDEYSIQTDDQLLISAEVDAVTIDANTAVEATDYFFTRNNKSNAICDGTFTVDSSSGMKFITITYDGINCAGKNKRSGQVVISMQKNKRWSDAGAVLNISYNDVKITRISDNKSITLNGKVDLTNESGGRMRDLGYKNIVHTIHSSGMNITFADGTKRSWQLAVKRVFSLDNGLVITSTGHHADGNKTGISAWGITRAGTHFVTTIAEPMIIRQDCNFRIVSAKLIQQQKETLTINFGLNDKGEPASCPAGSYYLKVTWNAGSLIVPY